MAQPIWTTPAGTLGTFPSGISTITQLIATPVLPATSVTYTLLSATLPAGLSIDSLGSIYGTPSLVTQETTSTFTIRATDNLGNIRDRTFSMTISGTAIPSFVTPSGSILTSNDSVWIELQIEYANPDSGNPVTISLIEGTLPMGLEINETGLIRGYAEPPTASVTLPEVVTAATVTETTNIITCLSTTGFALGRPVVFTGATVFGGLEAGITYYIKSIIDSTTFTISATQNGPTLALANGTGSMTVTLPTLSVGQPTIRSYVFTLTLNSPLGGDSGSYSMTIINQNTPISQGGPGFPANSRTPTIYNTRPQTFNITDSNPYYGYYVLPPVDSGYNDTYPPSIPAFIGTIQSDNYFAFKIIGHDFDGNGLTYVYSDLPSSLTGDSSTGWITGTPSISTEGINQFNFGVAVYKTANPTIQTPFFNFSFNLANAITGGITWVTPSNLGTIFNGTISTKSVLATSDVALQFRVIDGELPPNLTLLSNGQITGYVADQPTENLLALGDSTVFTFTIQAYSPIYPIVFSNRTFTLTVLQEFSQPTDILYIKATPSIPDRVMIDSLLNDDALIPYDLLYRPNDIYFGKASSVIYEHAYGIYASDIDEYIAAVTRNHNWRNITLGELKTAVARDENGNIIYEVVYSQVIDNLVNPQGVSVASSIYWPVSIDLGKGPWYTSVTDIFTSYANILGQEYYTSLSPGYARILYPNSLYNMRNRVAQVLGQEYDSRLLPLWMTSQQADGSTLGYTQAWVICYTQPGCAEIIKNNINNNWVQADGLPYTLNMINFKIDRFSVDKSMTYNYDNRLVPPAWTGLPSGTPVPDPVDSKDFYVLFPRQTILPDESQY
jgi:hypothetical protein